jgi:hypothetical protein
LPFLFTGLLVLRKVLVWVAGDVRGLFGRLLVFIACEFAAVWIISAPLPNNCANVVPYR